jgi:hypothetical protein
MTVIWKAPLLRGNASLRGNCDLNADDFCVCEVVRQAQAQILSGPVLRLENNYHDGQYRNPNTKQLYTERRAMLDSQTFFHNGDEIWWRTPVRLPADWIGWFPKWDELGNWPGNADRLSGGHDGGALYQIHHMPAEGQNGDWSKLTIGSAPLYVHATHKNISVEINSASGLRTILPLVRNFERGRAYEIVLHVKWHPDPAVIPLTKMPTSYNNVGLYAIIGFYRREHIGDPGLTWPVDAKPGVDYLGFVPKRGARVFPNDDGYPQSVEYPVRDRPIMIATAREDVLTAPPPVVAPPPPATPPAPPPAVAAPAPAPVPAPAAPAATAIPAPQWLVNLRVRLQGVLAGAPLTPAQAQAELERTYSAIAGKLDQGPRWTS